MTLDTGGTVYAGYLSGSGTSMLTFQLTVSAGQADSDGITVGALDLNGGTIRNTAGNDATLTLNGVGSTTAVFVDAVAPTLTGAVRTDDTHITVTLSEACRNLVKANDGGFVVTKTGAAETFAISATAQGADSAHVVLTVADLSSAGTAGVTVTYAPGTNGTISDLVGIALAADSTGKAIPAWTAPYTGGSSGSSNNGAAVIVNGQSQTAGTTATSTNAAGQTVTTVTVDTAKLENILAAQGDGATVIIPVTGGSDAAAATLTGAMLRSMEDKGATLVLQTASGSYTLPTSEIDMGNVAQQLGSSSLADIAVTVSISEPSAVMAQLVENAARDGGFTLMVPAVDYTITCTYGGQSVTVDSFNSYVERTIAIPDGVDPARITTGVVVDPDGTVHHVPTRITLVGSKYYAVINSLTNSTYSVIWNPVTFSDVASHWARDAINDMGSRMIVTGVGEGSYAPARSMTRAEFAAIVVRALGLEPGTGESRFGDVASTAWYGGYVKTAAAYGIITGYGDGSFGPNDNITREQAMTMLSRAMAITGLDAGRSGSAGDELLSAFTDAASVSTFAKNAVAACLKTGVSNGTSAVTLSPQADISRAEVAVMVKRLLEKSGLI